MIGTLTVLATLTIAQAPRTASIAGTVVTDAPQPKPIRRAFVSLNAYESRIGMTVVTDDDGRFAFKNLPAGRYNVDANKRGWVAMAYGAKAPNRPGTSIPLTDGQRATISIRLPRTAVISGTLVDERGQVPPGVSLRVMRYMFNNGERRLAGASGSVSGPDERGQYRIWGLVPGEYYIVATAGREIFTPGSDLHLTSDVDVQQAMIAIQGGSTGPVTDVPERSVGLAPLYYPGTPSVAQATPVSVRAGEERTGIDFTTRYATTSRVEGTVTGVDGSPVPPGSQISLVNNDPNTTALGFDSLRIARTGPEGRFAFVGIAPGAYTVFAQSTSPPAWANAEVDVQGEDVRGLALGLQECLTISGVIKFDGNSPPPPLTSVRASLQPMGGATVVTVSMSTGTNVDANGHFSITGVTPGRFRLSAGVGGPRLTWVTSSSSLGGQESYDAAIDIRSSFSDGVITLTDRLGELSGHAPPDGTVLLFSTNQNQWSVQSRRVNTTRVAGDGTYVFRNLLLGEYYVVALDDVEPGRWLDPAYLQTLIPSATKTTIVDGEKKTLDLRSGGT